MKQCWKLGIVFWVVAWVLLGLGAGATAEGNSPQSGQAEFDEFARDWVSEMAESAKKHSPSGRFLAPVTSDQPEVYTYRDYGEDYAIETKETGNAAAPFVGILSYTENTYECRGPSREDCKLIESSPIMEIFPFKDGKWQY